VTVSQSPHSRGAGAPSDLAAEVPPALSAGAPSDLAAEVPRWVLRVLAASAQAIAVALIVAIGSLSTGGAPLGAYLFAVGFGALLLLAHWIPVTVLIVSIAGVFAYYIADYPPIGMAVPVVGAFFVAAERGRTRVAGIAGFLLLIVALYFRSADGQSSEVLAYDLVTNAALIAASSALALAVRSRRRLRRQQERLVALERAQEQQRTARRVGAERLRIARDVHDSVGHALSVVSVQAKVGRQSLGVDDAAASAAFDTIVTASGESLADLRRTLSVLRSDRDPTGNAPLSTAGVESIAQAARDAGLDVELLVDHVDVPAAVGTAVFRITQEAVTNVLRHARARSLRIAVRAVGGSVRVEVEDDGVGRSAPDRKGDRGERAGRGISGMRERAEALGGSLSTSSDDRGFVVSATLPIEPALEMTAQDDGRER
jgi:signal transduction histidine kinase